MCVLCATSLTERCCPLCRAAFSSEHKLEQTPSLMAAIVLLYPEHVAQHEREEREAAAAAEAERQRIVPLVRAEIDKLLRVANTQNAHCISNKQLFARLVATGVVKSSITNEQLGPIIDAAVDGSEYEFAERLIRYDWQSFDGHARGGGWARGMNLFGRSFRRSTIVRVSQMPQHFNAALGGNSWAQQCRDDDVAKAANVYRAYLTSRFIIVNNVAASSSSSSAPGASSIGSDAAAVQRHAALAAFMTSFPLLPQTYNVMPLKFIYGRKLDPARHCEHCTGKTKECVCTHGCARSDGCTCYPQQQQQ
jgi:hypothetical protein